MRLRTFCVTILMVTVLYPLNAQAIKISDPKAGAVYSVPHRIALSWEDTSGVPLDSFDILVTQDDGRHWTTIAKNFRVNGKPKGWFDWDVAPENTASTKCRIKIKALYGNNKSFEMPGNFSLVNRKEKSFESPGGINVTLGFSQGLLRYISQNFYTANITGEIVYNFNDNNQSAGGILDANLSNESWEFQGGLVFNQKIMNIEFENIIIAKLFLSLDLMLGSNKRYVLALAPSAGLGIGKVFFKYSREFNSKQDAYEIGLGINLDFFFK